MNAKEYLYQLWNLDKEIQIRLAVLDKLRAQIGIRAMPDPDDRVISSGNDSDPVSDLAIKIADLERLIDRKTDRLIDLKVKIIGQIDGMENRTYRNILTCRYVLMQSWDQVAESVGYERSHCLRLHGRALQEFEKKYRRCY